MLDHPVCRRLTLATVVLALVLPATAPSAAHEQPVSREPNMGPLGRLPEGGIIEQILLRLPKYQDSLTAAYPVAYLMSHTADPERFSHHVNECATPEDGVSPLSQSRVRRYIDAGALTLRGGAEDLVLQPRSRVHDREGRDHDIAYHENIIPGDRYLAPGSEHEVHLAGSDVFPETTYEPGQAIYLPPEHTELEPGWPIDTVEIEAGQDFLWRWEPADKPAGNGLHHYHWIGFSNFRLPEGATAVAPMTGVSTTALAAWCLHDDTGAFTIPEATIRQLAAEQPEGLVVYGAVSFRFAELQGGAIDGRRLDFIGSYLYSASYKVVDSAPATPLPVGGR